jgi:hypothetical protein
MVAPSLQYRVSTFRLAGIEAKWGRTRKHAPIILVRNPNASTKHQRETWWAVHRDMFERMQEVGVLQAFDEHTALGDLFSMPV